MTKEFQSFGDDELRAAIQKHIDVIFDACGEGCGDLPTTHHSSRLRNIGEVNASLREYATNARALELTVSGTKLHRLHQSVSDVAAATRRLREAWQVGDQLQIHAAATALAGLPGDDNLPLRGPILR